MIFTQFFNATRFLKKSSGIRCKSDVFVTESFGTFKYNSKGEVKFRKLS